MSRFERRGSTLRFTGESGPVVISVCRAGLVRVALGGDGRPEAPSFVEPRDWPETPFEVVDEERVRLTTEALRLEVATAPLRLSFADAAGSWLLREPADSGMAAEPGPDGGGRVRASFTLSGEQHFYGLGHGGGRLDRLGRTRQLWNSHPGHGPGSDIGLPLLVSSPGYRRCRHAGRSASSNPRATSRTPPSSGSCRARSARGGFPATRSSFCRRTAKRRDGTAASGTSSSSPRCCRTRRRCSRRCVNSTSRS